MASDYRNTPLRHYGPIDEVGPVKQIVVSAWAGTTVLLENGQVWRGIYNRGDSYWARQ